LPGIASAVTSHLELVRERRELKRLEAFMCGIIEELGGFAWWD